MLEFVNLSPPILDLQLDVVIGVYGGDQEYWPTEECEFSPF